MFDWTLPDDPGELLAAIPALLGFYPTDSLVLVMLKPSDDPSRLQVGAVARHDLPVPGNPLRDLARQATAVCATQGAVGVLLVLIDSETHSAPELSDVHRSVAETFEQSFTAENIAMPRAWATSSIAPKSPWWNIFDPSKTGIIPDPDASAIAVAHVVKGRPIFHSRTELTRMIHPDRETADQVRELIDTNPTLPLRDPDSEAAEAELDEQRSTMLRLLIDHVDRLDLDTPPTVRQIAEIALVLGDGKVRSCLLALALTDRAVAAQNLWALLTRSLPDPYRADAATLLGYSAYVTGDGPAAGIALQAALASNNRHSLAGLLDTALRVGLPPDEVRRMAEHGLDVAFELGVVLGPGPGFD
ncbi:DUF4192 domain-containing protein [Nocardia sp. NPDC004068]|uniref:DUF4192 domain-containing protein n=1 Tax=Nocardia sp. NPDC004068 TaxID=3364303 RepID=UPI0036B93555